MGYRTGILSEAHGGAMPNDSRNCPPGQGLLEPPARMRVCSSRSAVSRLFVTPWTVACKARSSVRGFSRQEYWSGLPFAPPGDLPNPGIKGVSPALAGRIFFYHCAIWVEPLEHIQKPRSYRMILWYLVKLKIQALWLSSSTVWYSSLRNTCHRQSHARINMEASFTNKHRKQLVCLSFCKYLNIAIYINELYLMYQHGRISGCWGWVQTEAYIIQVTF